MSKPVNLILRVVCVLICIASISVLGWQWYQSKKSEDGMNRMRDLYPSAEAEELTTQSSFDDLSAANSDTVGWLKFGETIDFAIVQRKDDNEYYLSHNFFGEETVEGTAFMDKGCCISPVDQHLLIHGHNMRNGHVFGDLDLYRDIEFLKKYPIATFNTIFKDGYYVPFAIFDISAEPSDKHFFNMQIFKFDTQEDFLAYVNEAKDLSIFDIPVDVHEDDEILSLVTCSYDYNNGRLVIMLRRMRDDETVDDLTEMVQWAVKK